MKIGLMVEAQNGLTWERWSHILPMADRLGFHSLFRTDHFFVGTQRQTLDAFLSFVVAAKETDRIRFGPLCTTFSLRPPVDVGRMAAQIDVLSGGWFVLGLGVGWYEPEYRAYGVPFPPLGERYDRQEEGIELMRALWAPGRSTYRGRYYQIEDAESLPKPASGRPSIIIGGTGERRTLQMAANYADEWNCDGYLSPEKYSHKLDVLRRHCEAVGRDPDAIRRSMLVHVLTGPTQQSIDRVGKRAMDLLGAGEWSSVRDAPQEAEAQGMLVGSADQIADRLSQLAALGVEEVQLEHLDFDSDEVPEYIAAELMPKVADL